MITSAQCLKKFGDPKTNEAKFMGAYKVPQLPKFPAKIYCNHALAVPLRKAFQNIIDRKLTGLVKSWNGCFNIRKKVGALSPSLHSWGMAVDLNYAGNEYGEEPEMPPELVECFTDAGFDWGGNWKVPDGMHFQLSRF